MIVASALIKPEWSTVHSSTYNKFYMDCEYLQGYKFPGSRRLKRPWRVSRGCLLQKQGPVVCTFYLWRHKDKNGSLAEGHLFTGGSQIYGLVHTLAREMPGLLNILFEEVLHIGAVNSP